MERIFLSPPHMSGKEQDYIHEVFESNYIAPLGPFVNRFESAVQAYSGANAALAVTSGTAAIHLALRVLGIQENDVVFVSTFTFVASVTPVLYEKAIPVFIDSEKDSWNMDPELVELEILNRKKQNKPLPKAIIVTHLYGQPAKIDILQDICLKYGIALIEDAAESLGGTLKGQHTGTFGTFGVYSFNGNKILSTSGGGMLLGVQSEHIKKAEFYSTQAREPLPYYEHQEYGYNYRMSNVLAAIGTAQMEVIEERVAQKRNIFDTYRTALSDIAEIRFMPEIPGARGNRWLTTLLFDKTDPEKVRLALETENIESRPLWKPMHLQPIFEKSEAQLNGVSEMLFQKGLCLPSGTALTKEDLDRVISIIRTTLSV